MVVDGETGFVVAPDDVGALTARLDTLLGDAGRRRAMGEAGRRRMETVFTLEGFVAKMFAALDGAAAG
jgi:glycosyltransferase involved in cell wall biosynthesis